MKNQWLTIKQLDSQLKEWQALNQKYGKPKAGWIKTLRTSLSMSVEQLAERLGLSRGRINQLENAEIQDSVTLRTLKNAANALDCELIYAIVPKDNSTLEEIIKKKANEIAKERVTRVAHSMSLEAQSVDANALKIQKDVLVKNLIEHLNKKLWQIPDKVSRLAEAEVIYKKMQKNKEIPIKKGWEKIFVNALNQCLIQLQKEKKISEVDLNKFNDPEYINALKKTLIRYHLKNIKQNQANLKKLIDNLQKKK